MTLEDDAVRSVRLRRERHRRADRHARGVARKVLAAAKKDLSIQRYKGLGEMNPEHGSGNDDESRKRTLLEVRIDDASRRTRYSQS